MADERGAGSGTGGDDGPVFDESFVSDALISEDEAHRRLRAIDGGKPGPERGRRPSAQPVGWDWDTPRVRTEKRRRALIRWGIVAAAVVSLVAAVVFTFRPTNPPGHSVAAATAVTAPLTGVAAATTATTAAPTTTIPELTERSYKDGECVIWKLGGTFERSVKTVACDQPHFLEMLAFTKANPSSNYPTPAEWKDFLQASCTARAEKYLGHAIDPYGAYHVGGIIPLPEAWANGRHTVHCGIGSGVSMSSNDNPVLTAKVDPLQQSRLYPVGTCFAITFLGDYPSDCNQPHNYEVSGLVDAAGRIDHPPAQDELYALVGDECRQQSQAYLGHGLDDLGAGITSSRPESWAAGSTKFNCLVGPHGDGGAWGTTTGPLRG